MTTPDRLIVTDRYVWYVPCHGSWGATHVEFEKKMLAAKHAYRQARNMSAADAISDDAIRIQPGDEETIIYFDIERKP